MLVTKSGARRMLRLTLSREPMSLLLLGPAAEADFIGYERGQINPEDWTYVDGDESSIAVCDPKVFVASRDQVETTVVGFSIRGSDGEDVFVERFEKPVQIRNSGDTLTVVPRIEVR